MVGEDGVGWAGLGLSTDLLFWGFWVRGCKGSVTVSEPDWAYMIGEQLQQGVHSRRRKLLHMPERVPILTGNPENTENMTSRWSPT